MTDIIEDEKPETAPVETPSQLPDDRWLDDALKEFDGKTGAEPPAGDTDTNIPAENVSTDELDKLLADLGAGTPNPDQQRITALEGELNSVRAAEIERQARVDFEGWAKQLQSKLGPNVDESFARTNLMALANGAAGITNRLAASAYYQ